jgi:hypothetical protein
VAQRSPLGRLNALPSTNQKTTMSMTRDRELADLLYNSMTCLNQLQDDLNIMKSHRMDHSMAVALSDQKSGAVDEHHQKESQEDTPEAKAMADAVKKLATLHRQQEQLIKLLIQNHTDAASILNEFEKIRTAKLLSSDTFTLSHLIPTLQK